jgi:flagellar basal body rod protein FlgC
MNTIASIALSGLNAASTRLRASAHNIANLQTDGFRREVVTRATVSGGGVSVAVGPADGPGLSLIDDVVSAKAAAYEFKANVLLLRTQDRLLGALLDTRA